MLSEVAAISSLPFESADLITARFRVEEFFNFSVVYYRVWNLEITQVNERFWACDQNTINKNFGRDVHRSMIQYSWVLTLNFCGLIDITYHLSVF